MLISFRKIFFLITFNITLFLILMIGIQNSTNKKKVNLIISEYLKIERKYGL